MSAQDLIDSMRLLRRVERIYERYVAEGKRPSREECRAWLESLGWQPYPLANLMRRWGYPEE